MDTGFRNCMQKDWGSNLLGFNEFLRLFDR